MIFCRLDVKTDSLLKVLTEETLRESSCSLIDAAKSTPPNLVFLEDDSSPGAMLEKIRTLRCDIPSASIFVISSNTNPGHIVEVMKAGANEYFLNPPDPGTVRNAVEGVRQRILESQRQSNGKVYGFLGSKGGLGTTVLAVNTAAALAAQKSGKTALVDLNLQSGDSTVLLDVVPRTTLADAVRYIDRLDPAILLGTMEKHPAGLDLLAAPSGLDEGSTIKAGQLSRILSLCRDMYDLVVIDCPAMATDERTLETLRVAEKVFIVTDLSVPAVRNASRLLKLLSRIGIDRFEVVVNRFSKGHTSTLEEVEKSLGRRVYWLFPNDFEAAIASINRGKPLVTYDPRSVLSRNLSEFVEKLRNPAASPQFRGMRGLLGKVV